MRPGPQWWPRVVTCSTPCPGGGDAVSVAGMAGGAGVDRVVTCPHCGTERTTKARRNTRLVCIGCGEEYLAPGPPAEQPEVDDHQHPASGEETSSGIKVRRASS